MSLGRGQEDEMLLWVLGLLVCRKQRVIQKTGESVQQSVCERLFESLEKCPRSKYRQGVKGRSRSVTALTLTAGWVCVRGNRVSEGGKVINNYRFTINQ